MPGHSKLCLQVAYSTRHCALHFCDPGVPPPARRCAVGGGGAGNVWLELGRDKVDVGLCVKNAKKKLYVPDFATPLGDGDSKGGVVCYVLSLR